jgi:hypothetical protein
MQGAFRVSIAVLVVAGAAPATASAQPLDVAPVRVPSVSVPPVALPAPLPQVSTPPVSTPPVTLPGVRVDAPLPSPPQVQAPAAPLPRPATPTIDSAPAPAAPDRAAGAGTAITPTPSGQAPTGAVAAAGTPSASPARGGRVARAAAVRGGRGVLGTRFRSRHGLVNALSGCVTGLPARQERLLVLRYGVGAAAAHPDRAVASALALSRGEYAALRGRALRGLVHDARTGGCGAGAPGSTGPAIAYGGADELRAVPALSRKGSVAPGDAEIAVRGERASGGSGAGGEDSEGFATPLALGAEKARGSLLGALMLVGALGLLAVIAVRALRSSVRR